TGEHSYYQYNTDVDVEMLTDENGSVKATYGYNPYGEDDLTMFTGVDKPDSAQPDKAAYNDYRYGGQRWDANTQSYDLGFRDYFPSLGRFLSPDSYNDSVANKGLVMDTMTNNLYSYAGGNPVDFSDQDGHIPLYNGDDGGDAVQMYVAATGQLYHPSGKGKKASKSQMKRANQHSNSVQARNHKKPKPKPKPKAKAKPKPKPVAKPPAKCGGTLNNKSGGCIKPSPRTIRNVQAVYATVALGIALYDPLPGDELLLGAVLMRFGFAGAGIKILTSGVSKPTSKLTTSEISSRKVLKPQTSVKPLKLDLQTFAAKRDLKMVNDAAREVGIDRNLFGEYIHDIKYELNMKASDNFSYKELLQHAKDLKKMLGD
ncbi:RHS repeat-associated core domain-containing protein, partial [Shimazuella kribbensis]|uniref:RHS repeat-associated core domain-containing protein n=1 Tax=Shimazuella kribbensis TaxID=139808 RepID=UPI0005668D00